MKIMERIGKKELQRKNCCAMDESGDFKFTSVEEIFEAGRRWNYQEVK